MLLHYISVLEEKLHRYYDVPPYNNASVIDTVLKNGQNVSDALNSPAILAE